MNKGELVDEISKKAEVTKKQADAVLSAALEAIMDAVASGDKVTLVGFGSFESRERKAREGRNPKTGDKMEIPEGEYIIPIGVADIKRKGTDVTVVSFGKIIKEAYKAADKLAEEGISIEIIDLRTVRPMDHKAILESE